MDEVADAAALAELQHVLLLRLQDAPKLQQLSLRTRPICEWPAHLAEALPGRLQKVHVRLHIPHKDDKMHGLPEAAVDLSAFSRASGCTAALDISVVGLETSADAKHPCVAGILAGLCAVGSFGLLHLYWSVEHVAEHVLGLSQLQCSYCILLFPQPAHIPQLPSLRHLVVMIEERGSEPLSCEWAALASPGVHCLGSAAQPLLNLVVTGCPGLPAHGQPWALVLALVIWADMSNVQGLPVSCFVEEASGKHVWQNAAGIELEIVDLLHWC